MLSDYQANKLIGEHAAATGRLARIKAESKEIGMHALFLGSAFGAGAAVGFLNQKEGGSASSPYLLAGKVPLDTALAIGAVGAGVALRKKAKLRAPLLGAAAGAVGVVGARYGAQWQTQNPLAGLLSGASSATSTALASSGSTPSGASTSSTSTGYGGAMRPRMMPHGSYGARQNPYSRVYAR
jgi:hypothetical protein